MGRAVRRERFRKIRGLLERQPAVMLRRRADHNARKIAAAEAGEFRDLVLRRHHDLGAAAIEPVRNSSGVSNVVAGITTTPSLIDASMVSHSGITLPSSSNR